MFKKMTQLFIVMMMFILVVSFADSNIYAADDNSDVVLIYVEAPSDWVSPHLWAWDDDGNNAFVELGWPGKAMIEDDNNEGWFYLYVDNAMNNFIINNGLADDAAKQAETLVLTAVSNVWVTITPDLEDASKLVATADTTQATSGDLPTYVATKYLYAYIPIDWATAGLWAWVDPDGTGLFTTWPGEEMELQSDGWFMMEIPAVYNRAIITDLAAIDTQQTVDITLNEGNTYIIVGEASETDSKFAVTIDSEKPVILEDSFTLNITVPSDWDTPYLWAWSHPDGTNVYTTWPGELITYDDTAEAFVVLIPIWVNRIIISNGLTGDDALQTTDIELPESGDAFNVVLGEVNEDGKYSAVVTVNGDADIDDPNNNVDDVIEPVEPEETGLSGFQIILISVGVVIVLGGAAFFIIKKQK